MSDRINDILNRVRKDNPESVIPYKAREASLKPTGKSTYICNHCGKEFHPKYWNGSYLYCSRACAVHPSNRTQYFIPVNLVDIAHRIVKCRVCGEWMIQKTKTHSICSKACAMVNQRAHTLASDKAKMDKRSMKCKTCGKTFLYEYGTKQRTYCSSECRNADKAQMHKIRKRARKLSIRTRRIEYVSLAIMLERQNGKCPLCNKKIKTKDKYPSYLAPTIDHIVPLSLGGEHSYANCQVVHFMCNSVKRDRPIADYTGQMVLC